MTTTDRELEGLLAHGKKHLAWLALLSLGALVESREPAHALSFDIDYDASVDTAPSGFKTAFQDAIQFLTSSYSDPITITLGVGWGEYAGRSLSPGDIGESVTNQTPLLTYDQVRTALTNDAKSSADASAVASLPTTDPSGGAPFVMARAEGKALGIAPTDSTLLDGFVGFSSTTNWTFDPHNRAVPGEFDFIAVAEHEITHAMGRLGITQLGCQGCIAPIDLFRYTAPGVRDFVPVNGAYFSIDGGKTKINTFASPSSDLSDWAGFTPDAFNASANDGQLQPFSIGDETLMDVIGYDLVPEPDTFMLLGFGLAGLAARRQRHR